MRLNFTLSWRMDNDTEAIKFEIFASYIGFDIHTIATYVLLTSNVEIIVRAHC